MAQILITGASGFIGRRLAPQFAEAFGKENIYCFSYTKGGAHDREGERILAEAGIPFGKIDVLDPETLKTVPKDCTVIIHLAGTTDTDVSDFSTNDVGTRNLLEALGSLGKDNLFIFPGSSSVYAGRTDLERPVMITTPALPTNEYGRTKLRAEKILKEAAERGGFRLVIARFNTVYGPHPRVNSLLDVLKHQILQDAFVARLNWPGKTSVIHVDDLVRRMFAVVQDKAPEPFYLFSSESLTLADMYRELHKLLGKPYKEIALPRWFWKMTARILGLAPYGEALLPLHLYNALWRARLVAGDVLYYAPNDGALKGDVPDATFTGSIRKLFV